MKLHKISFAGVISDSVITHHHAVENSTRNSIDLRNHIQNTVINLCVYMYIDDNAVIAECTEEGFNFSKDRSAIGSVLALTLSFYIVRYLLA